MRLTEQAHDSAEQDEEEDKAGKPLLKVSPASSESDDDSMRHHAYLNSLENGQDAS